MTARRFPTSSPARAAFHWSMAVALGTILSVISAAVVSERACTLSWCLGCFVLAVAALYDVVSGRISNRLTYGAIVAGLACAALSTCVPALAPLIGGPGLGGGLEALAVVALVGGLGFWLGGFGAADLKLALGLAALVGLNGVFLTVLLAALSIGLLFVMDVGSARTLLPAVQRGARPFLAWYVGEPIGRPVTFRKSKLPMAPGFLVGFLLVPFVGPALASTEWL